VSTVEQWSQLANDNDDLTKGGWPEGQTRSSVNNQARDNLGALRVFIEDAEWIDLTKENDSDFTVARVSSTQFKVSDVSGADARSKFPDGTWVKVTGTSSPTVAYGFVSGTPTYSAPDTTVTLAGIIDADYASSDLPDTTITAVLTYLNRRVRQSAFHPVGTTLLETPEQIPTIDQLGDGVTKDEGPGNGFDADTLDGLHASAFALVAGGGRNAITNAACCIWQRNTSFTNPADASMVADRYVFLTDGAGQFVARESTIVNLPVGFRHGIKLTPNGVTNKKFGVLQILTGENSQEIIGNGKCSFSYYVLLPTATGADAVRAAVMEWSGTEDSPTVDVVASWAGTDFTPAASWAIQNTPSADEHLDSGTAGVPGDWARVTVEDVTITSAAKNIGLFVWLEDISYNDGVAWWLTGFKAEAGSVASDFSPRLRAEELALCLPHFVKTYNHEQAIATASDVGRIENHQTRRGTENPAAGTLISDWRFAMPMFKTPTVTSYSTNTGAEGKFFDSAAASDKTLTVVHPGEAGVSFLYDDNMNQGSELSFQASAEAEF
jgi:hypothetical protein